MNTFTLGACFQHELHTGPYFMTFAPRLNVFNGHHSVASTAYMQRLNFRVSFYDFPKPPL